MPESYQSKAIATSKSLMFVKWFWLRHELPSLKSLKEFKVAKKTIVNFFYYLIANHVISLENYCSSQNPLKLEL